MMSETAMMGTTPVDSSPVFTLRLLSERAERARAQAVANGQNLERALFHTRGLGAGVACGPRAMPRVSNHAVAEARIRELEETVDGLLKRLESQGPIEQAKGIIMAQTHCEPDQAFEILKRASQRSNTKLRLLAEDLVARTSGAQIPT